MERDRLVLGVAAVLAGLTVLLVALGVTYSLLLLAAAVPFGLAAGFMWYQATGRFAMRARRRRGRRRRTAGARARSGPSGRFRGETRRNASGRTRRRPPDDGPSKRDAYRTLGLDPGADEAAVRAAYRERVKEVHPDAPDGDEESFKRVNRAYETLLED